MGGLSRKAFQINTLTGKDISSSLVIDAGALLFKSPNPLEPEMEASETTARGVAEITAFLKTRAVGITPYDLAGGAEFLKQLAEKTGLRFLSLNLYEQAGKDPLFSPSLLTQAGNLNILIMGLTGPLVPGNNRTRNLRVRPWQETLPDFLRQKTRQADLVILLSSLPTADNRKIAEQFSFIHLIIESGRGGGNQGPVLINNTLLCRTASRGKYLGLLEIDWNPSAHWASPHNDRLTSEQNRLDRINWQIGRMEKRLTRDELAVNEKYRSLLEQRRQSMKKLAELTARQQNPEELPCRYTNRFIGLKTSLPEDRTVQAMVDATRREVNRINKSIHQRRRQQQEKKQAARNMAFPVGLQEMAGQQQCGECHPEQMKFWRQTDHSRAFQTLADKDQQYNPDCLLCHVTLPFYNREQVEQLDVLRNIPVELQNVGCEACHGPARAHALSPESLSPGRPTQATCRQCHTDERDDNFVFPDKVRKIRCPAG